MKYPWWPFCVLVRCRDIVSISMSILDIWYLFLCIALFSTLESNASFIDWSFFTVIMIGEMKCSSEQLYSFSIRRSVCNLSNSADTLGWRFMGTRRPFWCFAVNFWWNFDFAACVLDRPILDTKWGNCVAIVSLFLHVEVLMLLTHLPIWGCFVVPLQVPALWKGLSRLCFCAHLLQQWTLLLYLSTDCRWLWFPNV